MTKPNAKIEIACHALEEGYVFALPKEFNAHHVEVVEINDASDTLTSVPKDTMFIVKIKCSSGPFKGSVSQVLIGKDKQVELIKGPRRGFISSLLGSTNGLAVVCTLTSFVAFLFFTGVMNA